MKTKFVLFAVLALLIVALSSCVYVQPIQKCVVDTYIYGFWHGLWHGMIAGFTFIGSLFNHDIAIYAVNNNGAWYNLGFLLGVGGSAGGTRTVYVYRNKKW